MVEAKAMIRVPMVNSASAKIIIGFQPIASEIDPANIDPKNAPRRAKETINSLSTIVISGQVSTKYNWAPAIIPVSYPKRNPLKEPIIPNWMMN